MAQPECLPELMKAGFIDKLIDRLDRLDPGHLQTHFLRLAQEKGLLETIFNAIQEGVIVLDAEGVVSYANHAAESMLGFRGDKARGQPISHYLTDVDWERILKLDETEWANLVHREIEISYPRHRFVNFYVVPLSAVNPEEEGAVVMLRDVTRDRQDQASTLETERLSAVTLLAAGIAHEIGNPLNSLTIHLQLLDQELESVTPESRDHLRELVEVAHEEVARLDQIINQFLRAIRPAEPSFERGSLLIVLEETLSFLKPEIKAKDILVEVEALEDLPPAQIDPAQIKQAFFNIIRNAIQAMASGGLLKIQLSHNDRIVGVAFTDSGPGIPQQAIGHLFEPYHTTKPDGTGLGLMIVQRIVREHGGEIEVRSDPGVGTTFSIFLPRDERRIRLLKAPPEKTAKA
jgi:two-component system, sporulation sensor kinase E